MGIGFGHLCLNQNKYHGCRSGQVNLAAYNRETKDKMEVIMRNLTLDMPDDLQIKINGHIFSVSKSDVDILNECAEFQSKYGNLKRDDISGIKDAANAFINYIDEILGDGAVLKISGGKPVSISRAVGWLTAICGEISRADDEYISERYE